MARPVIVCIGTDKIAGDALGPMVGDFLTEIYNVDAFVYGKSQKNVNGINFCHYERHIRAHHTDSLIVAVDSCLGSKADIGAVKISSTGVKAGGALGKSNRRIGDIGILGVVGEYGQDNFNILKGVDKVFVQDLAFSIAARVVSMLKNLQDTAGFVQLARNSRLSYGL
jgi:putative sporulation protein YyaC